MPFFFFSIGNSLLMSSSVLPLNHCTGSFSPIPPLLSSQPSCTSAPATIIIPASVFYFTRSSTTPGHGFCIYIAFCLWDISPPVASSLIVFDQPLFALFGWTKKCISLKSQP
eukprot:scaffold9100_cov64-Attheya_sp.AAC.5